MSKLPLAQGRPGPLVGPPALAVFLRIVFSLSLLLGIYYGWIFIRDKMAITHNTAALSPATNSTSAVVAASAEPDYLSIPAIKLSAVIVPVGLNAAQGLQIPDDPQVGWYKYSSLAGQ